MGIFRPLQSYRLAQNDERSGIYLEIHTKIHKKIETKSGPSSSLLKNGTYTEYVEYFPDLQCNAYVLSMSAGKGAIKRQLLFPPKKKEIAGPRFCFRDWRKYS